MSCIVMCCWIDFTNHNEIYETVVGSRVSYWLELWNTLSQYKNMTGVVIERSLCKIGLFEEEG